MTNSENNRYFFYDLTIPSLNICIEFNGDYWHANPNKYSSDFKVRQKLAAEIWKYDEEKLNLIRKRNIEVFIVWEDEYDNDNKKCTRRIIDEIKRRI